MTDMIIGKHHALIHAPTTASMRALLEKLEANGVSPDQPLMFNQLANALGTFTVYPVAHNCETDHVYG